jgi:predicted nucleotidyltransferase
MMRDIRNLAAKAAAAYGSLPGVVAVAVAGSVVTGAADEHSDIDLYVYAPELVDLAARDLTAARFSTRREVGNAFWEPGDEWIDDRSGLHVDVMYRTPAWVEDQVDRVLVRHEASVGYTTCIWQNVLHSVPLVDSSGWYHGLQRSAAKPYPEPLKRAIIEKNHPILRRSISSYLNQIERAVLRGDGVAVQHRITALLASYFDVLFAINEVPHPGEKRLLPFVMAHCARLPSDLEAHLHALLGQSAMPASPEIVAHAYALVDALDDLLLNEGLIAPSDHIQSREDGHFNGSPSPSAEGEGGKGGEGPLRIP